PGIGHAPGDARSHFLHVRERQDQGEPPVLRLDDSPRADRRKARVTATSEDTERAAAYAAVRSDAESPSEESNVCEVRRHDGRAGLRAHWTRRKSPAGEAAIRRPRLDAATRRDGRRPGSNRRGPSPCSYPGA